jgi:hypothetical protein
MATTTARPVYPLQRPKKPIQIDIVQDDYAATQYEFYIPSAVWSHSAVRDFIAQLHTLENGATIFKTATGVWEGVQEDTNIYRLIYKPREGTAEQTRAILQPWVADMMAHLAEWRESRQVMFLFTEQTIQCCISEIPSKHIKQLNEINRKPFETQVRSDFRKATRRHGQPKRTRPKTGA